MANNSTTWLYSRSALLVRAVIAVVLAYVFASMAIDSGRWLHYFLTFLMLGLGVKFFGQFLKTYGSK